MKLTKALLLCALAAPLFGQTPSAAKIFDATLSNTEKEVVSLVEAMPADKFNFAPTQGAFKGVRTFGEQARHIATTLYMLGSVLTGEKLPIDPGPTENGPNTIASKAEVVKYLKDAFAMAHRGVATLTNDNLMQETTNAFNPKGKSVRVDSVSIMLWHSFDHYGQMVEYARMNNIIPPASR